jgi:hypothetical protein
VIRLSAPTSLGIGGRLDSLGFMGKQLEASRSHFDFKGFRVEASQRRVVTGLYFAYEQTRLQLDFEIASTPGLGIIVTIAKLAS